MNIALIILLIILAVIFLLLIIPFLLNFCVDGNFLNFEMQLKVKLFGIKFFYGKIIFENNNLVFVNKNGKKKIIFFNKPLNLKLIFKLTESLISKKLNINLTIGIENEKYLTSMFGGGLCALVAILQPFFYQKEIKNNIHLQISQQNEFIFFANFSFVIIFFKFLWTLILYGGKNGKRKRQKQC